MGTAAADRWTCPECRDTVAPQVPLDEVHEEIRLAQLEHAAKHAGRAVPVEVRVPRRPVPPPNAAAAETGPGPAPVRPPLTPIWVA